MLVSTRGIVVFQSDYSETSLIVKIYTEHSGLQSYIVKGVRKKGARIKRNLFGPLMMLDLVVYNKETPGLQMIREVSCHRQFPMISSDVRKSSVLLFMNELIYRSIPGEMPDQQLFRFICDSIVELDETENQLTAFPVIFALRLADHLGFHPHNNFSSINTYFDLQEGCYISSPPGHLHFLEPGLSKTLSALLEQDSAAFEALDHEKRFIILERVLDYFRLHLSAFGMMKSHQVLNTVLRD
jgi:DNA repair protein RecO (recombination protein O)